jgi:hypothetical protein
MADSTFGNASWHGYVLAAYAVVFLGLAFFTILSLRSSRKAVESLRAEGYLKD